MADNKYSCDYGKRVANCKKCKQKIEKGSVRLAKVTANPFSDEGEMKAYHHPKCLFETFKRARATTKIVEEPGDLDGFFDLEKEDQEMVKGVIADFEKEKGSTPAKGAKGKGKATPAKPKTPTGKSADKVAEIIASKKASPAKSENGGEEAADVETRPKQGDPKHKDNSLREFRRLCLKISDDASHNNKTEIVHRFFTKGSDGSGFKGDLYVWVRLLLPGVVKRIYNVQSKQLIKIFSRIFGTYEEDMLEDLEAGDVAETIAKFFEESKKIEPAAKAQLTVHDVDDFLDRMAKLTKEEEQQHELTKITKKCTFNDLKMIIRLIKHDLRIGAGAKPILEGLHKEAYEAFNKSRNVTAVIDKILELRKAGTPNAKLEVGAALMHPVQPMLAMACKSVDMAFAKCPNGMYSEIKYDGERVQLHKKGNEFKYFSRSLKPVLPHKVKHFAEYIPKAFPDGSDLILDAEVLMVDNKTGDPLPFGTLGKHKAGGFKDATPCLFVFDCIFYNGENLMSKPIKARRKHLTDHMKEVGNHVKFSEMQHITRKEQLGNMIKRVLKQGLEGLVLKDVKSQYEPGKRHWLKVKKDYLNEGAMADTADLVVLGAWYGTGSKGGIMSIFLMGTYDPRTKKWCTVTKVHTGLDEATLDKIQGDLKPRMTKIKQDYDLVPSWLSCSRQMAPDFVAKDPKDSFVWEITGAEFSKAELHTAAGISIRFPRITRRRDDKTWETATNLDELKDLFKASKEATDYDIDYSTKDGDEGSTSTTVKEEIKEEESEDEEDVKMEADFKVKDEDVEMEDIKENVVTNGGASYNKTFIQTEHGLTLEVVQGDLFTTKADVSLAHCISKDCKLGKGIAKIFREKFGRVDEIQDAGADIGGVAVLKDQDRFIYNLVTKAKYHEKPTYESLRLSLEAMRKHARANGVKEIAMPKIGCGLDGLQWNAVRTLVKNVFLKEKMKITVYSLDAAGSAPEPVVKAAISPSKKGASPKKQNKITDMFTKASSSSSAKRKSDGDDDPSSSPSKKGKVKTEDVLDIFDDWKVVLRNNIKGNPGEKTLVRYVIAYGGEHLKEYQSNDATHIFYQGKKSERIESSEGAKHLDVEYLRDCLKLRYAPDERTYLVE